MNKIRTNAQIANPNDTSKFLRGDGTWAAPTVAPDSDATVTFTDITNNNATTSQHGFLQKAVAPAANLLNVLGIIAGETAWAIKALFDNTNPAAIGTDAPGTATVAARRDHVHGAADTAISFTDNTTGNASTSAHGYALMATAPAAGNINCLGLANAETNYKMVTLYDATVPAAHGTAAVGTAVTAARRDHVHPSVVSAAGIGYTTGAGGAITQGVSRTTGVTLSKLCGNITMFSAAQAAQAVVTFTLTNTFIAATDFILVRHISATNAGAWNFSVVAGPGSCTISVRNISTASITEATPLRFTIIKGVIA